jgi:hypothetical protein
MAQDSGTSKVSSIRERMAASAATVQQYRARLIDAGVVAPVSFGELEFTLPYLGEYLRGEL